MIIMSKAEISDPRSLGERAGSAHHEAGHAVAHLVRKYPVLWIHIRVHDTYDTEVWGESATPPPILVKGFADSQRRHEMLQALVIGAYAGFEAERILDPSAPKIRGYHDFEAAQNYLDKYGHFHRGRMRPPKIYLRRCRAEARELVRRHWGAIQAVAKVLLEKGRLTGEEVGMIVNPLLRGGQGYANGR